MASASVQVSFRLSAESVIELEKKAAAAGVSRHEQARQMLISLLASDPVNETRDRVSELQEELQRLREDNRIAVVAILSSAGNVSVDDAKKWVAQNLCE